MLNAAQIIERKLLRLEYSKGKVAQVGYDLSVQEISSLMFNGRILKNKTILPLYNPLPLCDVSIKSEDNGKWEDSRGWELKPGIYEVKFWEGCDIPSDLSARIIQRSSLARSGVFLCSSIFDPGFSTEFMGTMINVQREVFIEKDARIGQIFFEENESVANDQLYSGQYQHDRQRVNPYDLTEVANNRKDLK